jgi:hypothetical protein
VEEIAEVHFFYIPELAVTATTQVHFFYIPELAVTATTQRFYPKLSLTMRRNA